MNWEFIIKYLPMYERAALLTVKLGLAGVICAIIVGLICAIIQYEKVPVARQIVILDLAAQGRTMIIVTHEMQFARAVADRIIFLEGGKIQEDETPDEFFEHPKTDRAKKFLNTFTFESVKRDI